MLEVLAEVIAPVLAVAIVGGWVCRRLGIEAAVVSKLAFFLFSPALVYSSMSTIELAGTRTLRIAIVAAAGAVACSAIGWMVSSALRHDRGTRAAVSLTAGMSNGGNLGLPVAALAFGDAGFDVAIIAFVAGAMTTNVVGTAIAASNRGGLAHSLGSVLGVPAMWAAIAGLVVNAEHIDLPTVISESTGSLAGAAVPVMLVVLGAQLHLDVSRDGVTEMASSILIRLIVGPFVAYGLAIALGLEGLTRDTLVVLGGMPAAVFTTILATQYGSRPALVTRTVVVGTLASVATLTVLIAQYR